MTRQDGGLPGITREQEAITDSKIEKMLAGHRQAPNGRNVMAFKMRYLDNLGYRGKFDRTFKGSPSSKEWWDGEFCPHCDRRRTACVCGTEQEQQGEMRFMAPRGVIKG